MDLLTLREQAHTTSSNEIYYTADVERDPTSHATSARTSEALSSNAHYGVAARVKTKAILHV